MTRLEIFITQDGLPYVIILGLEPDG